MCISDYGDDDALVESGLWSDIKMMLWDFIPDYTPLNFVLMHLFFYMVFLSFRAGTLLIKYLFFSFIPCREGA